jgi:phytoene dehydrogenase-like protein
MDATNPAVIVGGGIAGLTAAAYLARSGVRVTLYERSAQPGGMAATEESNGFRFNMGPHALYRGGPAQSVLDELGVAYAGRVPVADRALRSGQLHVLPTNARTLLSTRLLGVRAKLEVGAFLARLGSVDSSALDRVTLDDWLETAFHQKSSRELMRALTRVTGYTNDPARMSAGAALSQLKYAAAIGVIYLNNGWQSLVTGLREVAEGAGANVVTGVRVDAIEPHGESASIRLSSGETVEARAVIIAASPRVTRDLLATTAVGAPRQWADAAVPVRAACLDVALRRLPVSTRPFALGIDEPTYLSLHSTADGIAPRGMALLSLQKYLPADDNDPAAAEPQLERMLDAVQPGWREVLVERRFLPHMIVSHWLPQAATGGLAGRPGSKVPGADGVFVAGDWVGGEGMLSDAAFASGRRAATLALAHISGTQTRSSGTLEARAGNARPPVPIAS